MDPLNKAEEIASAWKALAGNSRSDEGWMTIPVSLKSSCKLLAGRHYPGNTSTQALLTHRITTMEYQNRVECSRRTAARDLDELLAKGLIQRMGAGRNAYYLFAVNRAVNLPTVPSTISGDS